MRNSRKQSHFESQDSLVREILKREQEQQLNDLLISQDNHFKNQTEKNYPSMRSYINFQGFAKANQFFKSGNKQKAEQDQKNMKNQSRESSSGHSTVTVSPQIKPKDTKLNKQLQAPLLKDLQDIGDKCGNCKPPQQGLNYKNRNKNLIQENERNIYRLNNENKNNAPEDNNKQKLQNEEKQVSKDEANKKIDLDQFKYDQKQTIQDEKNILYQKNPKSIMQAIDPKSKFHHIIQKSKVQSQQKLNIQGHTVYFPYQPYEAQVKYMAQVLNSLDKKQHAILESPTGTGKTLCLLSATLSWVQQQYLKSSDEVSIIYLSRTHSQLAQVQKQLQKTCFRPTIAIFGSREILCIKQELDELKGRDKVEACSKGVKLYLRYGKKDRARRSLQFDKEEDQADQEQMKDSQKVLEKMSNDERQKMQDAMCNYYSNERMVLELARTKFKNKIITTQKIKQLGKTYNFCPYYYPVFVKPICNLFFMPYNYLLDDGLNQKYKEIINKSILIFDEAHNVPESACEGKSFSITKRTFEDAKKELQKIIKTQKMSQQLMMIKMDFEFKLNEIQQAVDRIFNRITTFIAETNFPTDQKVNEEDISLKKIFSEQETEQRLFELLYERCYDHEKKIFHQTPKDQARRDLIKKMAAGIQPEIELLSQLCEHLQETPDGIFQNMEKVSTFVKRCIRLMLQNPNNFGWMQREINHYRLMVRKNDKSWDIEVICLVPFLALKDIDEMKPRNIILTSGTLSPLQTWDSELGLQFPIKFSNTHVINPDQLKLHVLIGQEKQSFNFSYKYLQENFRTIYKFTIKAIIDLIQTIPNGVLVITPSYKVMNSLEMCLQYNPELRKRLNATKKCFTQSKDSFEDLIKKYRKAAVQPKGALLFCVCRGKISEGIDFPNQLCRAVIFVGIPFPNVRDAVINEKKNHYDRISKQEPEQKFSGQKWYQNITFRSVNQAVGRVIRHINDFGTIFLMDLRYNYPKYRGQLPKWALKSYQAGDLTKKLIQETQNFYNEMEQKFGKSQQKTNFNKSDTCSFDSNFDESRTTQFDQKNSGQQNNKKPSLRKSQKKLFPLFKATVIPNKQNEKKNAFEAIMGTNQNKKKKLSGFSSYQNDFL